MSSAPDSNPAISSVSNRTQAAWRIVSVATSSFVLAISLMMAIRNVMAHDYVYAGFMLIVGPIILLAIILNARRILRAIP